MNQYIAYLKRVYPAATKHLALSPFPTLPAPPCPSLPQSLPYLPHSRPPSILPMFSLPSLHQPEVVRFSNNPDRMLADNLLSQDQCHSLLELTMVHVVTMYVHVYAAFVCVVRVENNGMYH